MFSAYYFSYKCHKYTEYMYLNELASLNCTSKQLKKYDFFPIKSSVIIYKTNHYIAYSSNPINKVSN